MSSSLSGALSGRHVVGVPVICPLDSVKPNPWNPNQHTLRIFESLKHGLRTDGWLASQALLVWGTDQDGQTKNLIIDGEHRWRAAFELDMTEAPMVFLHGLPEAKAKALTIAMNQRRGEFDAAQLEELVRSIQYDVEDLGQDLGLGEEDLMRMLAEAPAELPAPSVVEASPPKEQEAPDPLAGGKMSPVRMVQLFLDEQTQPVFRQAAKELAARWGTKTITDTVFRAVIEAAKGAP